MGLLSMIDIFCETISSVPLARRHAPRIAIPTLRNFVAYVGLLGFRAFSTVPGNCTYDGKYERRSLLGPPSYISENFYGNGSEPR